MTSDKSPFIAASIIADLTAAMLPNRELDPILAAWQSEVQYAVEAGVAPHLPLGSSDDVLTTLVAQEALRSLTERRSDMTQPLVSSGGASGAWLAALTLPYGGAPTPSPSLVTLYTGSDPATHVASGATAPRHPGGLRPPGQRSLPAGYRDAITPAQQPASPFAWETLPFRALTAAGMRYGLASLGAWAGWLGLLLALLLIVGAVLL